MVVKKFKSLEGVSQGHFPRELGSAKCYNICRAFGAVFKRDSLCIIFKRYSCDLRAHIDSCMKDLQDETRSYDGLPFPEEDAVVIIMQLAMGLKALHECGIYHRDLKAANILVTKYRLNDGKFSPTIEVTIADFERSQGIVGTGFYRAPEVLQFLKLKTKVLLSEDQWLAADIYSSGMVCYEVLTGKIPFAGHPLCNYDLVLDGGRPELPDYVPIFFKDIILKCWHADPNSRPCSTDIIQALMQNFGGNRGHIEYPGIRIGNLVSLESSARTSVESTIMKVKQLVRTHMEQLYDSELNSEGRGFVDHVYWALEFVATAEQYVSKFYMESPPEHLLSCKWPEFVERCKLGELLAHQYFGYAYMTQAYIIQQNFDHQMNVDSVKSNLKCMEHVEEILMLLNNVVGRIGEMQRQVKCAEEFDEEMSWIGQLLFCRAFIKQLLWVEWMPFEIISVVELFLMENPEDGV